MKKKTPTPIRKPVVQDKKKTPTPATKPMTPAEKRGMSGFGKADAEEAAYFMNKKKKMKCGGKVKKAKGGLLNGKKKSC